MSLSLNNINDVLHQILTSTAWAGLEDKRAQLAGLSKEQQYVQKHNRKTLSLLFTKNRKKERFSRQ